MGLLVAGLLLDRYDERWVVGIGACSVAAALAAGALATGYAALLTVLLVVGAGYSTVQPGGSKSVASWFDASQRGLALGIRQAGLPLGAALASLVMPVLAERYGLRTALAAGSLVALAGALAFMGGYRRPPAAPPTPAPGQADPAGPSGPVAPAGGGLGAQLAGRLRMLREPFMSRVLLSGTSLIAVQVGTGVLTVLFLHERAGLAAGTAALVLMASQAAGVVGRIGLAAWSDRGRGGRQATVAGCMVAVIAGMVALTTPLGSSPVAASLLFCWLGFFGLGWYGPWVAQLTESAPPERTGFALGLAMSVNQVVIVLVPPGLGLLRDVTGGFTAGWCLLSALTAGALAAVARVDRGRPPHRRERESEREPEQARRDRALA
ncbi:MFS transporter [Kitasatospora sp. NPDC054939]